MRRGEGLALLGEPVSPALALDAEHHKERQELLEQHRVWAQRARARYPVLPGE